MTNTTLSDVARPRTATLLLALLAVLNGCPSADESSGPPAPPTLSSIDITPGQQNMQPDATTQLSATGRYSDNSSRTLTDSVSWTSSNPSGVTVSDAAGTRGLVTAVGSGSATITATYSGKSGTATINILPVTAITVGPQNISVMPGATVQLSATAMLGENQSVSVTGKATWSSSDNSVATVSNEGATRGLVTGVGGGTATISASWKGAAGQTGVTGVAVTSVTIDSVIRHTPFPIGGTLQLRATARYSNGNQQTVTDSATWTSSTSAISVGNSAGSYGLLTRTGEDSSFISATFRGVTGTMKIRKGCVVLASGLAFDPPRSFGVGLLHVDNNEVVWLDYDPFQPNSGTFRAVPTTGGSVRVIKTGIPYVGQWVMDAQHIYWMYVNFGADQTYRIVRLNRTSGALDTLFRSEGTGGGARGIAVDATSIYYTPGNEGGVRRLPKAGGAHTSFFAVSGFYPRWISLDAATGTVYGVDFDGNQPLARRVPTNGGTMDTLALTRSSLNSAFDSGFLYWAENGPPASRLARVPATGGAVTTVATGETMEAFTLTGGYAYFAGQSTQTNPAGVYRQRVDGGAAELLTDACGIAGSEQMKPLYLATDGTYIYFTELSGNSNKQARILRVKK